MYMPSASIGRLCFLLQALPLLFPADASPSFEFIMLPADRPLLLQAGGSSCGLEGLSQTALHGYIVWLQS